jgi:hypothetical protein
MGTGARALGRTAAPKRYSPDDLFEVIGTSAYAGEAR